DRIVVIPNWIDCGKVSPQTPSPRWRKKNPAPFVVMYAGNIGMAQDLDSVLEAARLLRRDSRVKFVLVGDGARKSWLERKAHQLGLHNVEFIDRQPPSAMSEVLAGGDLH